MRYLYNRREYIDFPKTALQETWGAKNFALFALEDGTGAGPAVWCHSLKPDQHAFRGSYGGWVFPLHNHRAESRGHFLLPALVDGLAAAYGGAVAPLEVFDAMLALLSATSYTTRFAFDLEDDFPHVPFPGDPNVFDAAARIGTRIRSVEGFATAPAAEFQSPRLIGRATAATLDVPTPQRAFTAAGPVGTVALLPDASLRIAEVPERVWRFSVSGYPVLHRWLRARKGEPLTGRTGAALLRAALDVTWRLSELLHLFDEADGVLAQALGSPLTRADLGLPAANASALTKDDDDAPN